MLAELKFVAGSVAKKDFIPALKHFVIEDGKVRGYNGTLALCTPIPFDLSCKPKGEPLIKAIANCTETVQLALTKGGRLSIKSGKFKAFIDCIEGETPHVLPEGDNILVEGSALLQAFKIMEPFVGTDASRSWGMGVFMRGQSLYATNNVTVVEYWTGIEAPKPINIPRDAIREMLRINEPPVSMQMTDNSVTFHYSGERWLRTQLLSTTWPDLSPILDKESSPINLDPKVFEALATIKPFMDGIGRVYFKDGNIRTHLDENEGASYDVENFPFIGIYTSENLMNLKDSVKTIDWSTYPKPCLFFGERLRGALVGMSS